MVEITHIDQLIELVDVKFIEQAYQIFLGRAPDAEGLRYYLELLNTGSLKINLIAQLLASTEAKGRCVNLNGLNEYLSAKNSVFEEIKNINQLLEFSGAVFIEYTYYYILSRKPDPEGLRYYISRLRSGYTKTIVLLQIANSTENRTNNFDSLGLKNLKEKNKKENHWLIGFFSRVSKVERQLNRIEIELLSQAEHVNYLKHDIQNKNLACLKIAEYPTVSKHNINSDINADDIKEITILSDVVPYSQSGLTKPARIILRSLTRLVTN